MYRDKNVRVDFSIQNIFKIQQHLHSNLHSDLKITLCLHDLKLPSVKLTKQALFSDKRKD